MDSFRLTLAASAVSLPYIFALPAFAETSQPQQWRRTIDADPSPVTIARSNGWFTVHLADPTVRPGHALTPAVFQRMNERQALLVVVEKLRATPFSRSAREGRTITHAAAEAARAFLAVLPDQVPTPRVSPDGEGGLMFRWGKGMGGTIVILDGANLHAVANPTTNHARYFDDVPFSVFGLELPQELVEVLPPA